MNTAPLTQRTIPSRARGEETSLQHIFEPLDGYDLRSLRTTGARKSSNAVANAFRRVVHMQPARTLLKRQDQIVWHARALADTCKLFNVDPKQCDLPDNEALLSVEPRIVEARLRRAQDALGAILTSQLRATLPPGVDVLAAVHISRNQSGPGLDQQTASPPYYEAYVAVSVPQNGNDADRKVLYTTPVRSVVYLPQRWEYVSCEPCTNASADFGASYFDRLGPADFVPHAKPVCALIDQQLRGTTAAASPVVQALSDTLDPSDAQRVAVELSLPSDAPLRPNPRLYTRLAPAGETDVGYFSMSIQQVVVKSSTPGETYKWSIGYVRRNGNSSDEQLDGTVGLVDGDPAHFAFDDRHGNQSIKLQIWRARDARNPDSPEAFITADYGDENVAVWHATVASGKNRVQSLGTATFASDKHGTVGIEQGVPLVLRREQNAETGTFELELHLAGHRLQIAPERRPLRPVRSSLADSAALLPRR